MKKRISSLLLVSAMLLSLLPMAALAEGVIEEVEEVEEEAIPVPEAEEEPKVEKEANQYIAQIGTADYESLAAAVAAAKDGDTITLLQNAEGSGVMLTTAEAKTITIDLGGFTYTFAGSAVGSTGTETQGFHFEEGNTVTVTNGTLNAKSKNDNFMMLIQNYCDLTLDGVTVDGTNLNGAGSGRYVVSNNCGNVTIENSTITAATGDFAFDSCKFLNYEVPTVTVTDSTITGKVEATGGNITLGVDTTLNGQLRVGENKKSSSGDGYGGATGSVVTIKNGATVKNPSNYAVVVFGEQTLNVEGTVNGTIGTNGNLYNAGSVINIENGAEVTEENDVAIYMPNGTLNISGGEVSGTTAVYFKSTTLNITGGTLTGTGEYAAYDYNGNGCDATGDALVIDSCNYPSGLNRVEISGGTFTSTQSGTVAVAAFTSQNATPVTGFITGGTFSTQPDNTYLGNNTIIRKDSDTKYTVLEKSNLTAGTYLDNPGEDVASGYSVSANSDGTYTVYKPTSGGGGSNNIKTTTTTNDDGSKTVTKTNTKTGEVTETTTQTETAADGTVTETKDVTVTAKDGTVTETKTETETAPDGTVTETKDVTVTTKDGAVTETKTETETAPDGTVTETTTETETAADGAVTETKTETVTTPDGITATTVETTDETGETETSVEATVPADTAKDAQAADEPVTLPVTAEAAESVDTADTISVSIPKSAGAVKVEIPVDDVTPGTVAVLVKEDGTEEIVKTSIVTEDGVALEVSGDVTLKIVDNSKDFVDVADNHWADDAIDFVASREIFNGVGDSKFAPENTVTRAMLFTVLARFDNADVNTTGENWYADSMEWAKQKGVSDGTNPENTLSREQMATMLYRYAGAPAVEGDLSTYGDSSSVSDYAASAMQWAVNEGIINGMGGDLNPQGQATRAQLAAVMQRYCTNVMF